MKRGTDALIKFKFLQQRLGLNRRETKSILQEIWDLAAINCPRGDIGKFTNEQIAFGIEYDGNANELIDILVETGWLDRMDSCRLYIHDWQDHCEDSIHASLARNRQTFANGVHPKLTKLSRDEKQQAEEYFDQIKQTVENKQPTDTGGSQRQPETAIGSLPSLTKPSLSLAKPISNARTPSAEQPESESGDHPEQGKPRKRKSAHDPQSFILLEHYPRKVGTEKALEEIDRALKVKTFDYLLEAVDQYARSQLVKTTPIEFIPHPSTWFHQHRFDDDRSEWKRPYRASNTRGSPQQQGTSIGLMETARKHKAEW
jgi:hypothetical protein